MSRSSENSAARGVPRIRDHEALRCIGRGAYGEVWIARSVTGAFRAVKVVWREDYERDTVFEREFEGIRRYEPVSRTHPGLVDILQVGRNEDEGFYYYVMELADDVEHGTQIDPEIYAPHTFTTELMHRGPLPLGDCARHGAVLADALAHLHANDLIHRDVKPSNVIYVDGQPRLADIGLVALSGQRSFVGTEGFVPPEGPGTPVADIFSLGMVIYELSTGKDRLDFPDVPTDLRSSEEDRELWRRVNRVVIRACSSKADDRFQSGTEMAEALRGNITPERPPRWKRWATLAAAASAVAAALLIIYRPTPPPQSEPVTPAPKAAAEPGLVIRTHPEGAEVYNSDALLGVTPLNLPDITPGIPVVYTVRMPGFLTTQIQYPPPSGEADGSLDLTLAPWIQPQQGEKWANSLNMEFSPRRRGHISSRPIEADIYYRFIEETDRPFEGGVFLYQKDGLAEPHYVVSIPPYDAEAFRAWISEQDRAAGFLSAEHYYRLEPAESPKPSPTLESPATVTDEQGYPSHRPEFPFESGNAYFCLVEKQEYGSVVIHTSPPGAIVFLKGEPVGTTPHEMPRVKIGKIDFELRAQGYEPMKVEGEVHPDALLALTVDLQESRAVVFGRDWTNSLDMHLVPLGESLMASSETRLRDYRTFAKETGIEAISSDKKNATHPVTGVSRYDAEAFCQWLTERERERGLIDDSYFYRLPTDDEWSRAAGLPPERGFDPASRSARIRGVFPWGFQWHPPAGAGNFADRSATGILGKENVIPEYYDSYKGVAPVMSEDPNARGLWDLSGNVWEWIADSYGGSDPELADHGVIRGGSWRSFRKEELLSSYRHPLPPNSSDDATGFRIVLTREQASDEISDPSTSP